MIYIYDKNQARTGKAVETFLRIMNKIDIIQKTINICNEIDDDFLRGELEGKQCKLIQQLTMNMKILYDIKPKYSISELTADTYLIELRNQEQISSIEDQVKNYWKNQ